MRYFTLLLSIILSQHSFSQQNQKEQNSEALRLVSAWIDAQKDFDKLKGVSVAIVKDQDIIYQKGFGLKNAEANSPADPNTIYSICSISKLFTSIAIMQLWELGKLRLDDSLSIYLPSHGLKQKYPDSGPITIRSLLTHSGGLPRESDFPYWTDFKFPQEKQINEKLKTQETLYPASTYLQYSNLGMALLGQIISKISGLSYEQYIEQNILKPLRLSRTSPRMPEELWGKELAKGYSALYRDGTRQLLPYFNANGLAAAAGFSSTAEDLALFAAWQFRLLKNGGQEIIKASTLREMQRIHWLDADLRNTWGLGFIIFQVEGTNYVGHDGSCPGYRSALQMDMKEKLAVAVMANAQGIALERYTDGIFSILRRGRQGSPGHDSLKLEQYAGYYDNYAWRGEAIILPFQGKLAYVDFPNNDPGRNLVLFTPVSKDVFRRIRNDNTLGEELRFERNSSGKIIRFWRHSSSYDKMQKTIASD